MSEVERGLSYVVYKAALDDDTFAVPFPYLNRSDLFVTLNGDRLVQGVGFTITSASALEGGGSVVLTTPAAADDVVKIYRQTFRQRLSRAFTNGQAVTGPNLTAALSQNLFVLQELTESLATGVPGTGGTGTDIIINLPGSGNPTAPGTFGKDDVMLFLNGTYVHPEDFNLIVGSDSTEIELLIETNTDDKLVMRVLRSGGILNIDLGSVTTGAIADGAVTHDKLADECVRWGNLATGGWDSAWPIASADAGVQDIIVSLQARIAALEGAETPDAPVSVERKTLTITESATPSSIVFSFAPSYVTIVHGKPKNSTLSGFNSECGASFVVASGDSGRSFRHRYGNDSDNKTLTFTNTGLSGSTLTLTVAAAAELASGELSLIAYKE